MNNNYTLLDNVTHKDIRVINQYRAEFGDNVTSVPVFATELADIMKHYPVLFYPDKDTNSFTMTALLGLERNENLFLNETLPNTYESLRSHNGWATDYVPAVIARGPFAIGLHGDGEEVMVHIDTTSPRVSEQNGTPLFLPKGGNSDYLNRIASVLHVIHQGMQATKAMVSAWHSLDLLEPLNIDIELADGSPLKVSGYYTISQEKVAALSADDLHTLHQKGFLQGLFLALSSLSNIQTLVDLKNIRLQYEQRANA